MSNTSPVTMTSERRNITMLSLSLWRRRLVDDLDRLAIQKQVFHLPLNVSVGPRHDRQPHGAVRRAHSREQCFGAERSTPRPRC
jgi:hypothetical protein